MMKLLTHNSHCMLLRTDYFLQFQGESKKCDMNCRKMLEYVKRMVTALDSDADEGINMRRCLKIKLIH
jgi:hypothetical protein